MQGCEALSEGVSRVNIRASRHRRLHLERIPLLGRLKQGFVCIARQIIEVKGA